MLARRPDRCALLPAAVEDPRAVRALAQSGELWTNTWASSTRLFWGALIGGVPALVLGIVMGLYRPLRAVVEPIVAATYPVPKSAILPLIL